MRDLKKLASKGRYGDTMLAHVNPQEAALLKSMGGAGTINPKTGLPEFYGQFQIKQMEEQRKAEAEAADAAAKAKANAERAAAASRVLTPEERQANIARDLALSQTRGARPSGQDSQFYQPVYQPQYTNYANPLTAFNVSSYGTNPGMSKSMREATAPGAGGIDPYYKHLQNYANLLSTQGDRNNINTLMDDMRQYGISAQDLQNAFSYNPTSSGGGSNTLTPELARSLMQRAMTTGLPKSESDKYGGYAAISALYNSYGGTRDAVGQQVSTQPLQFNPYTNSPSYSGGSFPTQTPFSYQPATTQPQTPFSYQQPMQQQMQTPFSYQTATGQPNKNYGLSYSAPMQLPQYVYDTIRDVDSYQSKPVQAYQSTRPVSSGPSQAIVGRSSQIRGTPNVMAVAKAEGGIATLLKKQK